MMTLNHLLVVAGAGEYPRLVVTGAKRVGVPTVDVVAFRGSTDRATAKAADSCDWIALGQIASEIRIVAARGYDGVILAGQINPLSLFRGRFDPEVKSWLASLKIKNAHSIFQLAIGKLAEAGLKVLPASLYMDDNLPGEGVFTARSPSQDETRDIEHAARVVRDIGLNDIGQTVMVKRGMVLAVEAFEGTNAAIRRGGRLGGKGGVVFKAAREGHDMRFDIPVVGLKTLQVMHRAGATALAFQAGRLILLDRAEVLDYANRKDIAIVGVPTDLPPAPMRPE